MAAGWRRQSMDTQKRARLEITDRQGNRILSENLAGQTAIATLQGTALSANRGTSLNLDWMESVRVNLSAVERRAATDSAGTRGEAGDRRVATARWRGVRLSPVCGNGAAGAGRDEYSRGRGFHR